MTDTRPKPAPKPGDRVKEIGWAYPRNPNAEEFGYGAMFDLGYWPTEATARAFAGKKR